jgi:SAM-dependent methyltransferase
MTPEARKLHVGCGWEIRDGYINTDFAPIPGVDVCCDVSRGAIPFPDNTFDEVLALNVLEHVELIDTMREIHRVLKPGGKLVAEVPHFTSGDMYGDPTHRNFFGLPTFEFFTKSSSREYYFDYAFARIERLYLSFPQRKLYPLNPFIEWLVNKKPDIYETSILRAVPASTISVVLVK